MKIMMISSSSSHQIVNPNNLVRHNAAAGGTHFGFWYRLESAPSGPSAGSPHCPNKAPVAGFYNNTAHSMGRSVLWSFDFFFAVLLLFFRCVRI